MNSYLFVNPASGHYSEQKFKNVLERLLRYDIRPTVFQVRTPADIAKCCIEINRCEMPPLAIVAGGDGTINAVVNSLKPHAATLAVLPFGTSNVLAAELGISSIDDGLTRIEKGETRQLSLGVLEAEGLTYRFVLMAGIGLDGAVVRDVWPLGKKLLRQGAYALSALKCAAVWDSSLFEVVTPDGVITCHSVIICNASKYGGNFVLGPECSPFAAGLTALCVTGNRRSTYLRIAAELFTHSQQRSSNLLRIPASSLEIRGAKAIQIDGDFIGHGPARISTEADFARIIV